MKKRTFARELALQSLYQLDVVGSETLKNMDSWLYSVTKDAEILKFAKELICGCWEKREYLDNLIKGSIQNWDLHRVAKIDKNILRLATYELVFKEDIPSAVSINEAIEIAKKYSTKSSGQFVNGVLDNIKGKTRAKQESVQVHT